MTRLERVTNVLMSVACLVIIAFGGLEIHRRLTQKDRLQPAAQARTPSSIEAVDNVTMSIDPAHLSGLRNSDLVAIEFSDFECPFCGRYARDSFPQIERELVSTGRLAYVFRHFPLTQIHKKAVAAAAAAECARSDGKFWGMHHALFADQKAFEPQD